jgi:succinate dehydrogenase hydrophobic anchor subunit
MSPRVDRNGVSAEFVMALTGLVLAVAVIAFIVALH